MKRPFEEESALGTTIAAAAVLVVAGVAGVAGSRRPSVDEPPSGRVGVVEAHFVNELGAPIWGVDVHGFPPDANAARELSLEPPYPSARSDERGFARLELAVGDAGVATYLLVARHVDHIPEDTVAVEVRESETTRYPNEVLRRSSEEAREHFVLALELVDGAGEAVRGASLTLERSVKHTHGTTWRVEARGGLDSEGRADLEGEWLGQKKLTVIPSPQNPSNLMRAEVELDVPRGGYVEQRIVVEHGRELEGTIRTTSGEEPPASLSIRVDLCWAEEDGSHFVVRGVGPGPFRLSAEAPGWDTVDVAGLYPRDFPYEVMLARKMEKR